MKKVFTTSLVKEGKWYVARCVELGVISQGRTIEDAKANIKEAVELYLEDMPKRSIATPSPFFTTFEVDHV